MPTTLLWLAVLLPVPLAGQESNPTQESKPIPEIEILNRLDRNEDGFLESGEIPSAMRAFVKSLVKTSNAERAVGKKTGNIDLPLLETLLKKHLEKPTPVAKRATRITNRESLQYATRLISLYDANDDQHLTAGEFQKLSDKWIECDQNQDLQLDVIEVASGLKYALDFPRNADGSFDESRAEADRKALVKIYNNLKAEHEKKSAEPKTTPETDNSRKYAQALVANYDKDRNGSLDPSELKKIGQSWVTADFDKDGKATVDEIQVRFQRYDAQRIAQANADRTGDSIPNSKPIQAVPRKGSDPVTERPEDFAKRDVDGDGQIEMHEFAKEFNDSVVSDFYQRDASRDGVITLNEWNRFLADRNRESAKPPTKPESKDRN